MRLTNPYPLFWDLRGSLLEAGSIYIGEPGQDPESSPLGVFWDAALSEPAPQPLKTLGGLIVNGEFPGFVFLAEEDYSLRIRDVDGTVVANISSVADLIGATAGGGGGGSYQPASAELDLFAVLSSTPFGRSVLEVANAAALKTLLSISTGLATTGGTVTGNIVRSGAGVHPYFANSAMTGGRLYGPDPLGTADATSQPGDIQVFY